MDYLADSNGYRDDTRLRCIGSIRGKRNRYATFCILSIYHIIMIKASIAILLLIVITNSCNVEDNPVPDRIIQLNENTEILYHQKLNNYEHELSILLDSVNDSRCPTGPVRCFWEGNASVKFELLFVDEIRSIILNTHSQFRRDTSICGYQIELLEVNPYPEYNNPTAIEDYRAIILIREN